MTIQDLLRRYDAWTERRNDLRTRESDGLLPAPSDWHHSDDTAVALLQDAHPHLTAVAAVLCVHTEVWLDTASDFTCEEADAIAALLRVERPDFAEAFLDAHAAGDDDHEHYDRRPDAAL